MRSREPRYMLKMCNGIYLTLWILGQILVAHSLTVTPQNIPEPEGDDEVHFFCLESGNTYANDITWRDPQGNLYSPGSPSMGGNTRITAEGSRLSIINLLRTDTGNYRCYRNSNHNDFAEGYLLVYAPPTILNPMPVQEIHYGATSLIECRIDRGNPLANIHWLHVNYDNVTGNQILSEITATSDPRFRIVENGLEISNVQSTDEGRYRCYVQNSHGTEVLDIQAAFRASPQFVDSAVESELILPMGHSISLDCAAAGAPLPNYTWSVPPDSQSAQDSSWTASILDIHLSDDSDAGQYTCTVNNGVGSITRVFTVKIASSPQPTLEHYSHTITLDQPAMINCSVSAQPHPDFQWMWGDTKESLPQSSWFSTYNDDLTGTSTLIHTFEKVDLDKDCSVLVVCMATNAYGTSEQHFNLALDNLNDCPSPPESLTSPSTPSPPHTVAGVNEQRQEGSGDTYVSDEKSNTFMIVVGVFSVAVACIVLGVLALLVYFLKHFCSRKKDTVHVSSVNPTNFRIRQSSSSLSDRDCTDSRSISIQHNGGAIQAHSVTSLATGRQQSVDSGVSVTSSISQTQSASLCSMCRKIHVPNSPCGVTTTNARQLPSVQISYTDSNGGEGIYNRLNHNQFCSSFASCSPTHTAIRHSSSSSANSRSLLVQSQSSGELEDSLTNSVFINPVEPQRHCLPRQCSVSAEHHTLERDVTPHPDPDGMYPNQAYERNTRKFRLLSAPTADDKPHEYEIVV